MWWRHINYHSGRICDIHNNCRRETGLSSSYSLQATQGETGFFAHNYKNYTFKVMPFQPMFAPRFYTCMIGKLRIEWHALFLKTVRNIKSIDGMTVRVIYLDNIKNFSGIKGIIGNILTWSTNLKLILIYFECECKVFEKIPRELQDLIVLIIKA